MRKAIAKSIDKETYVNSTLNNGSTVSNKFTATGTAKTSEGKDFASTVKSPLNFDKKDAQNNWKKLKKN